MVKNVGGGNKSKGFARKNFTKKDNALRSAQEEGEVYAQVTKVFGGAMCQVVTTDGDELLCHIRGKFRGRGKRDNFIGNGTWLLVGLRDWEKEPAPGKLLNCDVIEVYNDADKIRLRNNITTVNWSLFVTNDSKGLGASDSYEGDGGIVFSDEKTQEYQELIESQVAAAQSGSSAAITTDAGEEIDIDDI